MQVFGDQDADGFYYGECNGQRGLVPSNIVAVVQVDDAEAAMRLLDDSSCQSAVPNSSVSSGRSSSQTSSYHAHPQGIIHKLSTTLLSLFILSLSFCLFRTDITAKSLHSVLKSLSM